MRQRSELLHLKAMVIQLEQLSSGGERIAMTSVVGQPEYWRRRLDLS
jgi:hypothetical protein